MIGKLMKDWAGNLKRGEVCACFVFAVLFAWAVLLPELGKFGLKQVALFSIGLSIVSASVLVAICDQIKQINRKERVAARRSSKQVRIAFLLCFAALEVSFLAVLLSNWPGFCSTDSNDIVNQVLGVSEWSTWHRYDGLANHHPIFYTFLVWVVFQATGGVLWQRRSVDRHLSFPSDDRGRPCAQLVLLGVCQAWFWKKVHPGGFCLHAVQSDSRKLLGDHVEGCLV